MKGFVFDIVTFFILFKIILDLTILLKWKLKTDFVSQCVILFCQIWKVKEPFQIFNFLPDFTALDLAKHFWLARNLSQQEKIAMHTQYENRTKLCRLCMSYTEKELNESWCK